MSQSPQIVSIDHLYPLVLNVGHSMHHADWNWKNVSSPFIRIFYVTGGTATLHMGGVDYKLVPGRMYFVPCFVEHSYSCDSDFSLYYVHIYSDDNMHANLLDNYDMPVEIESTGMDLQLIKRLCDMNPAMELPHSNPQSYDNQSTLRQNVHRNKERALSVRVESRGILYILLSRFLSLARAKQQASDDRIRRAVSFIKTNLSKPISIDELAAEACLSKDHLIRLFKKELGEPPLQYINHKKMELAQLLLITENVPVKAVAYMLGYDDHSYFIRTFRKHIGQSPLEYRKSNF